MYIRRVIEVWEKGMDGAPCGEWPVADTITTAFLFHLFGRVQRVADPDMLLSYFLNPAQIAALQPYVAQEMRPEHLDFILAARGGAECSTDDALPG